MDSTWQHCPRVNAALLPSFQGKGVTLIGIASAPSNDGRSFQLTTCDERQVLVMMAQPIEDYMNGLIEVRGIVNERNNIACQNYILFGEEATRLFDMDSYNRAIDLIHRMPDHYPMQ